MNVTHNLSTVDLSRYPRHANSNNSVRLQSNPVVEVIADIQSERRAKNTAESSIEQAQYDGPHVIFDEYLRVPVGRKDRDSWSIFPCPPNKSTCGVIYENGTPMKDKDGNLIPPRIRPLGSYGHMFPIGGVF